MQARLVARLIRTVGPPAQRITRSMRKIRGCSPTLWLWLAGPSFAVFFTSVAAASEHLIDDGPAIHVFPVHEEIARDPENVRQAIRDGETLFRAKFNVVDGAGRPFATGDSKPTPRMKPGRAFQRIAGPDASACASCHNEPAMGGSGDSAANAFVGAHFTDPPTQDASASMTNERNTVTTFGSGVIELVAMEMSQDLHAIRRHAEKTAIRTSDVVEVELKTKGVSFGKIRAHPKGYVDYRALEGIDHDLIVKPFGIKGVAISLREFTIAALNQHHGMQAIERFGWERTGVEDFDGDGVEVEFSIGQVTALTLFQAQLPPPEQQWSRDANRRRGEMRGQRLFEQIGCGSCHRSLPLRSAVLKEPNAFNRPGSLAADDVPHLIELDLSQHVERLGSGYIVRAFTDLKRHDMCDDEIRFFCNEQLKQDNVGLELFMTQKLWDIATSAPYGHRGNCSTLSQVILGHGGEARQARHNYSRLPAVDRKAVLAFLRTLGRGEVQL